MKKYLVLLILVTALNLNAQFLNEKYSFGFGIITTSILGDNRATLPLFQTDSSKEAVYGGSFEMVQSGVQAQYNLQLGDEGDFRVPFSLKYTFYSGKQRVNLSSAIADKFTHSVNQLSVNAGFEAVFYRIEFARARFYTGFDLSMNYFHNAEYVFFRDYRDLNDQDFTVTYSKPNALRFGGDVKIGLDGKLKKDFYINTGVALSLPNLIGREDSRGELLTPLKIFENQESLVTNFHFYILLQYHVF